MKLKSDAGQAPEDMPYSQYLTQVPGDRTAFTEKYGSIFIKVNDWSKPWDFSNRVNNGIMSSLPSQVPNFVTQLTLELLNGPILTEAVCRFS
jgi:hypothetical protein